MKIALIGWYGYDNAGDERLLLCIKRFFSEHEILVFAAFEPAWRELDAINACDFVLIGGGGLILRNRNCYVPFLEGIQKPLGCIGISIEAVGPDNTDFIQILKEKSEFIYARDKQSSELFSGGQNVIHGPDLSFLYPFDVIEPSSDDTCGLNLLMKEFWKADTDSPFDKMMRKANKVIKRIPPLRALYPLAKWNPSVVVDACKRHFSKTIPLPFYLENNGMNDADAMQPFFPSQKSDNYFSDEYFPETFNHTRYLVLMRLHAQIFACQMGIPFIGLIYSSKNKEFCSSIKMEDYMVDIYRLSSIEKQLQNLKGNYVEVRENLLHFREENYRNAHSKMSVIKGLM